MLARAMKKAEEDRAAAEARGEPWNGGDGIMVPTANGNLVYSHYWVAGRRASEDVRRALDLFGLSPSARSKVSPSDNRQGALFGGPASADAWSGL